MSQCMRPQTGFVVKSFYYHITKETMRFFLLCTCLTNVVLIDYKMSFNCYDYCSLMSF